MSPRPLAFVAVAVLLVAANAKPTYEQLRATFMEKVAADQRKLKYFDDVEKYAVQYGTPEVAFSTDVVLAPGGTGTASAGCNLTKEGALLSIRDDVEVTAFKVVSGKCEVTLRAAPEALAGVVQLDAIAAVSGRAMWVQVARVKGTYTFELTLENGWRARAKVAGFDGEPAIAQVEFTKQGESKPFRTVPANVSASGTSVTVDVQLSEEEVARQAASMQAVYAAGQMTEAELKATDAAGKELEKCTTLKNAAAMVSCMEKPQQKMAAIQQAVAARAQKAEAESPAGKEKLAFGCTQLSITREASGTWTGDAKGCEGRDALAITGVKMTAAK